MRRTVLSMCVVGVTIAVGGSCNPGAAGIVLMPALFDPCDYDGTLMIELTNGGRPNWGGTTDWHHRESCSSYRGLMVPCATIEVAFSDDEPKTDMKPAGTTIEVYRGTERLRVPSMHRAVGPVDGSCGYRQVEFFDLSGLEPGTYSLVHRRSSGINGQVSCGNELCTWGTFQGKAALVTNIVVPRTEDLPQLTVEEIASRFESRLEKIRRFCGGRLKNAKHGVPEEDVVADFRIVEDGTGARAEPPKTIQGTELLAQCVRGIASHLDFDSHPPEPMIVRCRVKVSTDPKRHGGFRVEPSLVDVFVESRGEARSAQPADE